MEPGGQPNYYQECIMYNNIMVTYYDGYKYTKHQA